MTQAIHIVKTSGTLLALTQQVSNIVTKGTVIDVSQQLTLRIAVTMGRTVATALTNEVGFRLEVSLSTTGNDNWVPMYAWQSQSGKVAANSTTLNGATSANASSFIVTSATGVASGDFLYLRETGTPANSEWSKVATIGGTTVTPVDNLTRAHTNSIAISDLSEYFTFSFDVSTVSRVRLVVDSASANSGASAPSGQTVDVMALYECLGEVVGLSTVSNIGTVTVGTTAVSISNDATLKILRIRNSHTTAMVAIGGAGVTIAAGAVQLAPGDIFEESDAAGAAWFAVSDTAGTIVQLQGIK